MMIDTIVNTVTNAKQHNGAMTVEEIGIYKTCFDLAFIGSKPAELVLMTFSAIGKQIIRKNIHRKFNCKV